MSIQVWTLHSPCGCFTWNIELHFDNLCQGNEAILKVNVFYGNFYVLLSCCCSLFGNAIYNVVLDSNLYPIAFGVEDHTFIIPVAGGSWLSHYLDTVIGHLLGQAVHLFFGTHRKR